MKVLDFGIAKLAEQELPATMPRDKALILVETNLGSILGTVRYMSPEQACGGHVDKRTDIWSLGVVLYEMVTGHAPFTGDPPSQSYGAAGTPKEVMSAILEKEPPPLTHYVAHAPAELQQIISKTLRKDREERYHSAHELLQALKDLRHKLEVEADLARAACGSFLAALDTIARRSGARIVSSCFGAGAPFLLASEPADELTTGEKHRRAAIPRS